jgi:hypothetical protein
VSDRFFSTAQADAAYDLAEPLAFFTARGFRTVNPYTGETSYLSEDGEQVPCTVQDLRARFQATGRLAFQYWRSQDFDLVCTVSRRDGFVVEDYHFANPEEHLGATVQAFVARCSHLQEARHFRFGVFDLEGRTAEEDWFRFTPAGGPLPPGFSVSIFPESRRSELTPPSGYQVHVKQGLIYVLNARDNPTLVEAALHSG